jgi:putative integral membrane protein (TIGR02587 family)
MLPSPAANLQKFAAMPGSTESRQIASSYLRGLLGGMLIGAPVLMTMEVWWEGFTVEAWRLVLLYCVNYFILLILQHYSGLSHRKSLPSQASAALVALGIGTISSAITLFALGVLRGGLELRDIAGKLILESVPVSIGASVAMSEFGDDEDHEEIVEHRRRRAGYFGSLAIAVAGATLFGFGISATEEPVMIADQLDAKRAALLMLLSMAQVFFILFMLDHKNGESSGLGTRRHIVAVLEEAVSTYAAALLIGAYFLWTFGALDASLGLVAATYVIVATGFITSLGASAAEVLI